MLFNIIKIPAKFAIKLYCRNVKINTKDPLSLEGPLLIACNHPNSFLDAIILATLFDKPIYSLARGDSFKKGLVTKILYQLNILPVYRLSEGAENLNSNYDTFSKCREIFKKNGIVLIFSEGLCINEWKLRALKKGTARLAFSSWEENINVTILPTGINYHSFRSFGKNVHINFGNSFGVTHFNEVSSNGNNIKQFNELLKNELTDLVTHIDINDHEAVKNKFSTQPSSVKKFILFLPSIIGRIIHYPMYKQLQKLSWKKAGRSDHYDSILVGLLFLTYPIFLVFIATCFFFLFGSWYWLLTFVLLPFFAWAAVQLKREF